MFIGDRIRDSSIFATGQRSKIGRYEVHMEVSLPGFGIGMLNEDFHIAGIYVVTERLKRAVIYIYIYSAIGKHFGLTSIERLEVRSSLRVKS